MRPELFYTDQIAYAAFIYYAKRYEGGDPSPVKDVRESPGTGRIYWGFADRDDCLSLVSRYRTRRMRVEPNDFHTAMNRVKEYKYANRNDG